MRAEPETKAEWQLRTGQTSRAMRESRVPGAPATTPPPRCFCRRPHLLKLHRLGRAADGTFSIISQCADRARSGLAGGGRVGPGPAVGGGVAAGQGLPGPMPAGRDGELGAAAVRAVEAQGALFETNVTHPVL